ncbi:YwmB family TATA-box binding protein [Caldanaerobius polysaccharolyticus]|uniref:YwmB family TATA-box binding protein n=1 Tax=Caldanaerobius polysaccharolyticus TaxID=44256 RepID=UPI00047C48E2|nr:YwmB family TATA-box binding protein [Caldanaerobius polysaccharolyticus]
MVKKIFIGIIILISAIMVDNPVQSRENRAMGEVLEKAFYASGAEINAVNINGWAMIQDKFVDQSVMKNWMEDAIKQLNLHGVRITEKSYRGFNEVKMEYSDEDRRIVIVFQSLNEGKPETYLIVDEYAGDLTYMKDRSTLEKLYQRYGKEPQISMVCEGTFKGRKSYNELEKIKGNMLASIHAAVVNDGFYDDFLSVTAFSPEIKEYVAIGGEKININVAMRYSSYDDKTHIYLASPIITTEY